MSAQFFGLDIGRSFIKVVEVKQQGGKKYLNAAASLQTPLGGMQSESPIDLGKISDAVRDCVKASKIETNRCVVSLIESQVVTRLIQLPHLTEKELGAAINWEAEQYIPLPIKDVNLKYKVVSKPQDSTSNEKIDVLLIASPKRVIDKYLNIMRNAGLAIEAVETESLALVRSLTLSDDPATVIVSFGALSTELVIAYSGNVLFTRSVATGGVNLTRALMAEFNLTITQAEEYKQSYGILEDKLSGKVAAVIKPILDILISEITKAVEFAHEHVQDSPIWRIIICGGGAYLPGLSEFLTSRTSLEVSAADPWRDFVKEGLILKLPGQGGFYAVATGLALRS